ncbi:hypothetical protein ANN_02527 [Periplaneta americana]|uniref:Uncharacterized protein n=1 Tax=Periplaneta americana TaxID=6978 RepID=A0ABQ8TWM4_PERAM|nr:hypothetical protein ANN_02527 [Periplaneta americana]
MGALHPHFRPKFIPPRAINLVQSADLFFPNHKANARQFFSKCYLAVLYLSNHDVNTRSLICGALSIPLHRTSRYSSSFTEVQGYYALIHYAFYMQIRPQVLCDDHDDDYEDDDAAAADSLQL